MRLAVVHSYYDPRTPSGENTVVDEQVTALANRGHDVLLIARRTDGTSSHPTSQIRSAFRVSTGLGRRPDRELEAFNPHVVHIHNLHPNWGATWLDKWSECSVITLHNYRPLCASGTLFRNGAECQLCQTHGSLNAARHKCFHDSTFASIPLAIASRNAGKHHPLLKRTRTCIVLNSEQERIFAHAYPEIRMHRVPNFVSVEPSRLEREDTWVYAGRLTEEKGILSLMRSWPAAHRLTVIGSGPLEDQVGALAIQRGILFRGRVDQVESRALISRSNGVIIPSMWSEGLPTVALEALSYGRPVIASSQCSGLDEIVGAGAGAWLPDNYGDSQVLSYFLQGTDWHSIASRAQALYASQYSPAVWLDRVERVYSEVVGLKGKR